MFMHTIATHGFRSGLMRSTTLEPKATSRYGLHCCDRIHVCSIAIFKFSLVHRLPSVWWRKVTMEGGDWKKLWLGSWERYLVLTTNCLLRVIVLWSFGQQSNDLVKRIFLFCNIWAPVVRPSELLHYCWEVTWLLQNCFAKTSGISQWTGHF